MTEPETRDAVETDSERSLVPLVDVVFLLLVFFMLAEIGTEVTGELDLQIPGPGGVLSETVPEKPSDLVVSLARGPGGLTLAIDGVRLRRIEGTAGLYIELARVAALASRPRIVLDVADGVTTQDVVGVYDVALDVGLRDIVFADKTPPEGQGEPK